MSAASNACSNTASNAAPTVDYAHDAHAQSQARVGVSYARAVGGVAPPVPQTVLQAREEELKTFNQAFESADLYNRIGAVAVDLAASDADGPSEIPTGRVEKAPNTIYLADTAVIDGRRYELYAYSSCDASAPDLVKACRGHIFAEIKDGEAVDDRRYELVYRGFPYIPEMTHNSPECIKLSKEIITQPHALTFEGSVIRVVFVGENKSTAVLSTKSRLDAFCSWWAGGRRETFGRNFVMALHTLYNLSAEFRASVAKVEATLVEVSQAGDDLRRRFDLLRVYRRPRKAVTAASAEAKETSAPPTPTSTPALAPQVHQGEGGLESDPDLGIGSLSGEPADPVDPIGTNPQVDERCPEASDRLLKIFLLGLNPSLNYTFMIRNTLATRVVSQPPNGGHSPIYRLDAETLVDSEDKSGYDIAAAPIDSTGIYSAVPQVPLIEVSRTPYQVLSDPYGAYHRLDSTCNVPVANGGLNWVTDVQGLIVKLPTPGGGFKVVKVVHAGYAELAAFRGDVASLPFFYICHRNTPDGEKVKAMYPEAKVVFENIEAMILHSAQIIYNAYTQGLPKRGPNGEQVSVPFIRLEPTEHTVRKRVHEFYKNGGTTTMRHVRSSQSSASFEVRTVRLPVSFEDVLRTINRMTPSEVNHLVWERIKARQAYERSLTGAV